MIQLVASQEVIQLVASQEVIQLVASHEVIQLVASHEVIQPITSKEAIHLVASGEVIQLVASYGVIQLGSGFAVLNSSKAGDREGVRVSNEWEGWGHTPSIAFRHPPPNSARFSYATEGVLFTSAQLSNDAVSALRKVLVRLWKQPSAQART